MPTTRHLEIPGTDPGRVLTFEHRDGDDVATISTTRGRQVSLGIDELNELEEAVDAARYAIADAAGRRTSGAPAQRAEIDGQDGAGS